MPSLSKLASFYANHPSESAPEVGVYIGLLLFFMIGSIVAVVVTTSKSSYKELLIAGIMAPAMITNIMQGSNEDPTSSPDMAHMTEGIEFSLMGVAHAAETVVADFDAVEGRSITLYLLSPGLGRKERAKTAVKVLFRGDESDQDAEFLASEGLQVFNVPDDVTGIRISAGGASTELEIPRAQPVVVDAQLTVIGKRDFLWVLGAKRQLRLSITASVRDVISISEELTDPLLGTWTIERWKQQEWKIGSALAPRRTRVTGDLVVQKKTAESTYQGVVTFYLDNQARVIENVEISMEDDEVSMIGTVVEGKEKWTDDHFSLRLDGNTLSGRARDDQPGSSFVTFVKTATQGTNQER